MLNIKHYIGNAEEFPALKEWIFLNHAAVAPIPRVAGDAMRKHVAEAETTVYLGHESWWNDIEKLRESSAKLIHGTKDEIAFVKNTSEGISFVANGIEWRQGDRIVTTNVEYPANIYPWMDVAQRFGAEVIMVKEEADAQGRQAVPMDRIMEEAAHPRTRMVAISHVEFASGQRIDVQRIGEYCRAHGKLLCVDAIQSVGILPVDVQEMKIDFLSADGHKWLLGPQGAGIFYCRKELIESMKVPSVGWLNVVEATNFLDYRLELKPNAQRFESGCLAMPGFLGLKASLELLAEIGIENIAPRIKLLTDRVETGLVSKGYQILSPRTGDMWSGNLCFTDSTRNLDKIFANLREQKIELALRVGRMRCSPHFYNTEAQIDRFLDAMPN